jgi:MFS family permease
VRRHYNVTFALLAIAAIGYALLQSLVAPALPDIQHALHTSVNGVSWVLTAYLLSASIATPLIGRLGDMYGKQRLLVVVLVVLCGATVISAVATSLPLMLAGRVVQGAAGGVLDHPRRVPARAGRGRHRDHVRARGRRRRCGCRPGRPDRQPPLIPLPLLAAADPARRRDAAIHLFVPESPIRVHGRVNWLGAALMAVGLGAVLVAVSETPVWHWLSAKTLVVLAVGLAVLVAWVVSEAQSEQSLVDMRMMRIRGVWTTNAVALLLGFGMYASFVVLPEYVETPARVGYGFSASVTGAGLFLLPSTLAILVAGAQTGRLEKRFGSKPPLLAGAMTTGASYVLLAAARSDRWEVYVAALLLGTGIGLAFAAMVNLIIENVGPAETGVATGMNAVTRTVGGAFGGAAVASIVAASVGGGGFPSAHGFTVAFAACAVALALGVVAGLAIPQRRPADTFVGHEVGDLPESASV